jgi:hypothetical protein
VKALLAAHAADLLTFSFAIAVVGIPISAELNPTMVAAYTAAGLAGVALWKGGLVALIALLVGRIRTRSRRPAVLVAYALGLVGTASNVVTVMLAWRFLS